MTARPPTGLTTRPDAVGILGGMGPLATADFMRKVIELTPANRDPDHIPLIVSSCPELPDRIAPIMEGSGVSPLPDFLHAIDYLKASGARAIAIPCNTAHHWHGEMAAHTDIPVLHIVDAVIKDMRSQGIDGGRVGLLATQATLTAGIYQGRLADHGYECHVPPANDMMDAVLPGIALVKKNGIDEAAPLFMRAVQRMLDDGATAVILGCTEIPAGLEQAPPELTERCIDSNLALAQATVDWALAQR